MQILSYDHVGLRVTDRTRALTFYRGLGFELDAEHSNDAALEIVNGAGVRMNLILNAVATPTGDNVLLDRAEKWPGYTHAAFVVERLSDVLAWAQARGVVITEGPVDWGRRLTCFLRDPDSNVLEFNELTHEPYDLVIGQKNYSSFSMRAWLALRLAGAPFAVTSVGVYTATSRDEVRALGGETGLVPVLRTGDAAIWDTLAILEFLHERHGRIWPADSADRARARSLAGEVHAGFNALRAAMPVNTRARGRKVERTPEVDADIARVVEIWSRERAGSWLCGDYGGADIMFAPIATRFQTYGVALSGRAKAYQDMVLAHDDVAEWLRLGAAETDVIRRFEMG